MQPLLFNIPNMPKLLTEDEATVEFERLEKDKVWHPVFLVQDKDNGKYFVSRIFKRVTVESYKNFKIVKSTETNNN